MATLNFQAQRRARQKKASAPLDEPWGISNISESSFAPAALQLNKTSHQSLRKLGEGSDDRQIWTAVRKSRSASGDINGTGLTRRTLQKQYIILSKPGISLFPSIYQ
jgi:hypothetical protein